MEPHSHPDYDETLNRIINILDVMAEQQLTTERSLQETAGKIAGLVDLFKVREAETTDKLNGLIDLMDRHLREHRDNQS